MSATEELLTWGLPLGLSDVPAEAQHAACRHLLDGVGLSIVARRTGVADASVNVARGLGGPPEAELLGDDDAISAPAAALADGALVHGIDFDDTHAAGKTTAVAWTKPPA